MALSSILLNTPEARTPELELIFSKLSFSLAMLLAVAAWGLSIEEGNGKSLCFSMTGVGVGDSRAFLALLLSAVMRLLSRTSPPLGESERSSKTFIKSVGPVTAPPPEEGPLSIEGVEIRGMPSKHWPIARASFKGPTGLARNPMSALDSRLEYARSNRADCEQRARTAGPLLSLCLRRAKLATSVSFGSLATTMSAFSLFETNLKPYQFVRKFVTDAFNN